MYHRFFIHSFNDGHLHCSQHLVIVNSAAMNSGMHTFFELVTPVISMKLYRLNILDLSGTIYFFEAHFRTQTFLVNLCFTIEFFTIWLHQYTIIKKWNLQNSMANPSHDSQT